MENNMYYLVKKYKHVLKGYIYNTSEKISEKLYSIRCLTFDNVNVVLDKVNKDSLWNGIYSEITHRVMRQVDQDSLYRINLNFEAAIKTKDNWNSTELIMMRNEITKNYKKELYSSIVKKMKKFEVVNSVNSINVTAPTSKIETAVFIRSSPNNILCSLGVLNSVTTDKVTTISVQESTPPSIIESFKLKFSIL